MGRPGPVRGVFRVGGWALLAVLRASLVGLIAWLVFRACRSSGAGTRVAAWLTLAGFGVGLVALGLRPQLLGMVLFAATIAILAARDRRPSLVWAIPLLVVVWANVHGSFFLGPAAVVVAWLEDEVTARPGARRLLLVALVCLAATLIGPYLGGVWVYATGLAANPTIRSLISEWQATSPLSFVGAGVLRLDPRRGRDRRVRRPARIGWSRLHRAVRANDLADPGVADRAGAGRCVRRAWGRLVVDRRPVAVARLVHAAWAQPPSSEQTQDAGGRAAERRSLVTTSIVAVLVVVAVAILPIWRGGDPLYGPTGLLTDAPRWITDAVVSVARPEDRIWNAQRWGSWLEFAVPRVAGRGRLADRADPRRRVGRPRQAVRRRGWLGRHPRPARRDDRGRVLDRAARADPADARVVGLARAERQRGRGRLRPVGPAVNVPPGRAVAIGSLVTASVVALVALPGLRAALSQTALYDGGITASAGTFIRHGAVPYRDFWLLYGPLTGYVAAIWTAIFGNDLTILRLASLVVVVATAVIGYGLIGERVPVAPRVALAAIAALVPVYHVGPDLAPGVWRWRSRSGPSSRRPGPGHERCSWPASSSVWPCWLAPISAATPSSRS